MANRNNNRDDARAEQPRERTDMSSESAMQEQQEQANLILSAPGEPAIRKTASAKSQPIGFSGKLTRIDN